MSVQTIHPRLNPNVESLGMSATVAINERSNALRAQGREIFKLGLGESPFPVPDVVVEALQSAATQKNYLPVKGLAKLREVVAEFHRQEFGIDRDPEDVFIGPGSKELMFLLQLAYDGDLIIPAPSWVSYAPQARIIGRAVHWIETHEENDWLLAPEDLEALCRRDPDRQRIVILNYPSNPTGQTYSRGQLRALANVARKYQVVLLSDEIYGKLHHEGRHESVVPMYAEGTIFSSGLSKWCGAGGWRLGVFIMPPELRRLLDQMAAIGSETFTATCNPIQHAAVRAFQMEEEIRSYLHDARRVLKALGNELARRLQQGGARVATPQGAFYLFPDFSAFRESFERRGIHTSQQMCERLLEDTGVAILPGSSFGHPGVELTARLAYVDFDGGSALNAARQTAPGEALSHAFLAEHAGRILEAVDRINEWVQRPF